MFRFRVELTALLVSAIVVVIAVGALLTNQVFSGMTAAVEEDQFQTVETIVTSALTDAENRAIARAQMIADLPSTKTLFETQNDASRAALLNEYLKVFEVQRDKYGVAQMQFHSLPAVSFLRLQAPANYGDDLSQFRPLVVAVNQDRIARKAGTVARTGPAIFGVVPVFGHQGQHLGSFEVGIDFGSVLDSVKAAYGLELALLISEEPLRRFVTPELVAPLMNDANRVGKYIKTHATHWDLLRELVGSEEVATLDGPERYTQSAAETPYGVVLVPIRNLAGDPIGVVAAAKDFSASRSAAGRSTVLQALVALVSIVLLTGAAVIVVRGLALDPIEERKKEAAAEAEAATAV